MQHARTIMLVLSLQSGNISPQYHFQINDSFMSVMEKNASLVPASTWQYKAKFEINTYEIKRTTSPLTFSSYDSAIDTDANNTIGNTANAGTNQSNRHPTTRRDSICAR
jgi:hypothetical protein